MANTALHNFALKTLKRYVAEGKSAAYTGELAIAYYGKGYIDDNELEMIMVALDERDNPVIEESSIDSLEQLADAVAEVITEEVEE